MSAFQGLLPEHRSELLHCDIRLFSGRVSPLPFIVYKYNPKSVVNEQPLEPSSFAAAAAAAAQCSAAAAAATKTNIRAPYASSLIHLLMASLGEAFLGEGNVAGKNMLKLCARGSAIISELLRLSENIPSAFLMQNAHYSQVLLDYQFFKN